MRTIDINQYLIIVKGIDKTEYISEWSYSDDKYHITFTNGRTYSYSYSNVIINKDPKELNLKEWTLVVNNQSISNVCRVLCFERHIRIFYKSGAKKVLPLAQVKLVRSCLRDSKSQYIFDYLKQLASVVSLKVDGINILAHHYNKIDFIREDSVLAAFLDPSQTNANSVPFIGLPLFPFGFNISQKQAVNNALNNDISIIEGPPGTGKTQTILNIISNIIMNGQTVAVVSGNNSATANIFEKLEKYDLDFLVASLGSSSNKEAFINQQKPLPDMVGWQISYEEQQNIKEQLLQLGNEIDRMLIKKNRLSKLRTELMEVETEKRYFDEYYTETYGSEKNFKSIYSLSSSTFLRLWNEFELLHTSKRRVTIWVKIKLFFQYGIYDKNLYNSELDRAIAVFQQHYYIHKINELRDEINSLESELNAFEFDANMARYSELSMALFKSNLFQRYHVKNNRMKYELEDLWKNSEQFMKDYPVILSTTYSLRSSLSSTVTYDYLIIDESSQVDLVTGALAFSCANRAIIVGDQMQLPNVVSQETETKTNKIYESFDLPEAYQYAKNSLLSASVKLFDKAPRTLLREHYRCHPKIIEFCNQKFYDNQLIVLTDSDPRDQPLKLYKTVAGNHARGRSNQREIDVIFDELIPNERLDVKCGSIGIITPYNKQIEVLEKRIKDTVIEAATVHKYQGREKDCIILTTVDNQITEFTDMPNLLNVAVSRAVKQLFLVTSGNKDDRNTNINDLVNYIEYNNFEVIKSEIYSVFDYLYKDYAKQRSEVLKRMKKISVYDSENLMYALLTKIIQDAEFRKLRIAVHVPLKMIIRDFTKLDEHEVKYAINSLTHVDFLIYDKLSHKPVLAIEVDGTSYHKDGTRQAERDRMKDSILTKYTIPFLRLRTDESNEEKRIRDTLTAIMVK